MKVATKDQLQAIANVSPKELRQELGALLCKLTPQHLQDFRQRVIDGEIDGDIYIDGKCGCIYGTVAILEVPDANRNRMAFNNWLIEHFPHIMKANSARSGVPKASPLEDIAFHIGKGSTPEDNPYSAWLLEEVDRYIEHE